MKRGNDTMKEIKKSVFIYFNIFYPLVILFITKFLMDSFGITANKTLIAAIILIILLCLPYVFFTIKEYIIPANEYLIFENAWLLLFSLVGRYVDKDISFGYEVWGLAFILMKMWDSYLIIQKEKNCN